MKYLITGTSSGLGFELASQLIKKGNVIGVSRKIGKSKKLSQSKKFKFISFDLGSFENKVGYSQFIKNLKKEIGKEDFTLIINAAKFYSGKVRLSIPDTKKIFDINLFSVMSLVESLKNNHLKRILIINSISGLVGQTLQHEYVSSKHALMGYAKSLIKEKKKYPFDVMCINPGGIKTKLWNKFKNIDTRSFIDPKELAKIIVSLITTKQKLFIENMTILPSADV